MIPSSSNFVIVYDATHANVATLPPGAAAGYTTGTPDVRWTDQDWANHPYAIRICQDTGATDTSADVLDVENYAATYDQIPNWSREQRGNARPGKRNACAYMSASTVPAARQSLATAGEFCNLWLAKPNTTVQQAMQLLLQPTDSILPLVGVQYDWRVTYDVSVFTLDWYNSYLAKEAEMVILRTVNPSTKNTVTFLFNGVTIHHVVSPSDEQAFEAAGLKVIDVSWEQINELTSTL